MENERIMRMEEIEKGEQGMQEKLSQVTEMVIVITVSHSSWMTIKINGVATDLFCTGVIGHSRCVFLN